MPPQVIDARAGKLPVAPTAGNCSNNAQPRLGCSQCRPLGGVLTENPVHAAVQEVATLRVARPMTAGGPSKGLNPAVQFRRFRSRAFGGWLLARRRPPISGRSKRDRSGAPPPPAGTVRKQSVAVKFQPPSPSRCVQPKRPMSVPTAVWKLKADARCSSPGRTPGAPPHRPSPPSLARPCSVPARSGCNRRRS